MPKFPRLTADVVDDGAVLRVTVWHHAGQSYSRAVNPFANRTALRTARAGLLLTDVDRHDEDAFDVNTPCRSTYVYARR